MNTSIDFCLPQLMNQLIRTLIFNFDNKNLQLYSQTSANDAPNTYTHS